MELIQLDTFTPAAVRLIEMSVTDAGESALKETVDPIVALVANEHPIGVAEGFRIDISIEKGDVRSTELSLYR